MSQFPTFIHTAAVNGTNPILFGGSPYTGLCINLSPDRKDYMWIMKSLLKTAGWRVIASGDVAGNFSSSGDVFSNNTTNAVDTLNDNTPITNPYIARSMSNYNPITGRGCWFIVAPPLTAPAQIYICVQQCGFVPSSLRIKVSCDGGWDTTTGTTNQVPSLNGGATEGVTHGSGTDAAPLAGALMSANNVVRFNMGVDSDVNTPCYYIDLWGNNSNTSTFTQFCDFLTSRTTGDNYPYVYNLVNVPDFNSYGAHGVTLPTQGVGGWTAIGSSGTVKCSMLVFSHTLDSILTQYPSNYLSNKEDVTPCAWGRPADNAPPNFFKGLSRMYRLCGAAHDNGDHIDTTGVTTLDFMTNKQLAKPWNAAPTTCVR